MITRKDFLNGMALTLGTAMLPPGVLRALAADGIYYPPLLTGMRGDHPGSYEVVHSIRGGTIPGPAVDTGETYDLVVVGAGISGLTAAYAYRKAFGSRSKILILDNHDDFGGHAKRNEFRVGDQTLITYGGTESIEFLQYYTPEALDLLQEIGINLTSLGTTYDTHFYDSNGLAFGTFFDSETFGRDQYVPSTLVYGDVDRATFDAFLAAAPLDPQAKQDIVRIYFEQVDYLPGLTAEQKRALLDEISLTTFFSQYANIHPDVVRYYNASAFEFFGVGMDAVSARDALLNLFPSNILEGMGIAEPSPSGGDEGFYHFPDGNASVARLLVRSLVPRSLPGDTMQDSVTSQLDYAMLDRASSNVRIRLNSPVVHVTNVGNPAAPTGVTATYVTNGNVYSVKATNCVMACWNMVIPFLCPEMSTPQKDALRYGAKVPLVYTKVAIRNWTAFKNLGLGIAYCPGAYFSQVGIDFPVSIGSYRFPRTPDDPMTLHLVRVPVQPGLSNRDQYRAGRLELLNTPFSTFEDRIKDQLGRMLGASGFDPQRDIDAITVNRWPHGYSYGYSTLWDPTWPAGQAPHEIGRQRFGRITIANADAAAFAETSAAIEQAMRAVNELKALG